MIPPTRRATPHLHSPSCSHERGHQSRSRQLPALGRIGVRRLLWLGQAEGVDGVRKDACGGGEAEGVRASD